jgi:hypothetical protein
MATKKHYSVISNATLARLLEGNIQFSPQHYHQINVRTILTRGAENKCLKVRLSFSLITRN